MLQDPSCHHNGSCEWRVLLTAFDWLERNVAFLVVEEKKCDGGTHNINLTTMPAEPLTGSLNYVNEGDIAQKRGGSGVRILMVHNLRYFPLIRRTSSPEDDEYSLVTTCLRQQKGQEQWQRKMEEGMKEDDAKKKKKRYKLQERTQWQKKEKEQSKKTVDLALGHVEIHIWSVH